MERMEKWIAVIVILFQTTPASMYPSYLSGSTWIVESIDDLRDVKLHYAFDSYEIDHMDYDYQERETVNEIKLLGSFHELSTTITIYLNERYNNVRIINLSGNHLRSVTKFHFTLDALRTANLSHNEIENLDSSSIFEAHQPLQQIDLSFNRISSIHSEAFNDLSQLENLFLNNNQLTEIYESLFAPLFKLKYLTLNVNKIKNIENNSFGQLKHLQLLYLENNDHLEFNLSNSVQKIFASNCSITKLIFNDNEMGTKVADFSKNVITGDISFGNWKKIEILDLSFNRIENVSFVNCSQLSNLNLSHNNLTLIPNTTTTFSNMKILDLSFNCIENFDLYTFHTMSSLEVLNLRNSCFKSLDYGTFSFQSHLRVLDISFNNLQSIDLTSLSTLTKLENLFIDGNNLTNVQSIDIGIYFPQLKSIGLTHNAWQCRTLSTIIRNLSQLRVKFFVESSVYHITNIKGIGCTTNPKNSSHDKFIVPENPMPINHTLFLSKIEKINEIVKTVNRKTDDTNDRQILDDSIKKEMTNLQHDTLEMKSKFDDRINQLKVFGKGIVDKFQLLNEFNFDEMMRMKVTIEKLNETNNEKYDIISKSIESLKEKMAKLNKENVDKAAGEMLRVDSEHFENIRSFKSLEIVLIILLFVLFILALYVVREIIF